MTLTVREQTILKCVWKHKNNELSKQSRERKTKQEAPHLLISSILQNYNREGNGTPLQYSCLENPMGGGAWWAAVHGVAKSRGTTEQLHLPFSLSCIGEGNGNLLQYSCLENPRDRDPGGLPSVGLHRVEHD